MKQQTTDIAPVTKVVTVNRPLGEAFRIFTEGIATWWPLATHSIYGDRATQRRPSWRGEWHRGWERHGDRAAELRGRYLPGWDVVLGRYVTAVHS